ncbi:MAG: hypothetical protein PUE14_10915 [Clostridia bacterium]|nr:hypothetical protein [Clostridia bacterium]
MPRPTYHSYPCHSVLKLIGYLLLVAGIILLFTCIPGWAWLALIGLTLMAAGWLILRLCSAWR